MQNLTGDLWAFAEGGFADVLIITVNGSVNTRGQAVMGRGCAKQAATKFPELPALLGEFITRWGNVPMMLRTNCPPSGYTLVTMPVKYTWQQPADIKLITVSAQLLVDMANRHNWQAIIMPRPGCGNGLLNWSDVEPVLEPILDDRFHTTTFER